MNDLVAWGAALGLLVSYATLAKFWMDMGATKRDASAALKKADATAEEFSNFRTSVAEKYASVQALAASEARLAAAIEGMRADFRAGMGDMGNRIDRVLSAMGQAH